VTYSADYYLECAVKSIDAKLGEGFAKKHPELIAAFMQTCAIDFGLSIISRSVETFDVRGEDDRAPEERPPAVLPQGPLARATGSP
jgi:hypothetical protein